MQAVLSEANERYTEEHKPCHCESDDDVARYGERGWDHPEQVTEQDEDEKRENEREIFHPLAAGIVLDDAGHELNEHFRTCLYTARHKLAAAGCNRKEQGDHTDNDHHPQRRVGKAQVETTHFEWDDRMDFKLCEWAVALGHECGYTLINISHNISYPGGKTQKQ